MVDIAVVGPGAIGGTLAAWLTETKGNEVFVCTRAPFAHLSVEVPGGRTIEPRVTILCDPRDARPVDWIFTATKTYDTEGASRWIERLVGPETCLAVVQNGIEHLDRFSSLVPRERTLPVIVDLSAERSAPGRIRQRRLGQVIAPEGELGRRFATLLATTAIAPVLAADFTTEAWRKLVLNSAGVVQALTRQAAGVVQNEKAAALMHAIALETIRVGRAVGGRLEDTLADEVLARFRAAAPDAPNSLLLDHLAGRPLEIDARNGVVVRLGAAHGVAVPLNAMAVAILEASSPAWSSTPGGWST